MRKFPITIPHKEIEAFCKKHHIVSLGLFGSILTPRFSSSSDIDVLVRFDKKHIPHLIALAGMEFELSDLLSRRVDLRTPGELSRYFRDEVVAQAEMIYGH